MALIFDIETIGADFDKLDETTQHSLTRWIKREAGDDKGKYNVMLTDLKEGLGFSPLTGEIVAVGVYDTEKEKGVVYYSVGEKIISETEENDFVFKPMSELGMLQNFWQGALHYNEFVSFNGRSFDVPFLMVRSAVHKVRPSMNLMANRYLGSQPYNVKHIDLLDQLSFYGAVRRKGNLHLYCQAFGIKSPKAEGITGDDVGQLFKEGEYEKIARYNSWDLTATAELYKKWRDFVKF
jgi:uncharacterized protein YprB with RNaseH-like and TPR domain